MKGKLQIQRVVLLVMVSLISLTLSAQSKKAYLSAAENSFITKDYFSALAYYSEVLEFDRELDILYKAAESARLFDAYSIAADYYSEVQSMEDNGQYPEASFYLGLMLQKQGKYEEAAENYQLYLSENEGDDSYLSRRADKEIKACNWAKNEVDNPRKNVEIERKTDEVNTPYSEFGAIEFDSTLYYSSLRFAQKEKKVYPDRLYSKVLVQSGDTIAVDKDFEVQKGLHSAHSAFNKEGSTVYYTICEYLNDKDIRCDLYSKTKGDDGNWGAAVRLPDFINLENTTSTQPNVGYDEKINKEVLYFVSDREGGKGKLDIWYSIIGDGEYSQPMNLSGINTIEDDITPFFHNGSQVLYFSSEGYLGMGGFDIYKVSPQDQGWGSAEHMGYPLNTSFNDIYFTLAPNNEDALFSSNRTGALYLDNQSEACCYDIYDAKIYPSDVKLDVFTFDAETLDSLNGVTVTLLDLTSGERQIYQMENLDGAHFDIDIDCNREYKIIAFKTGYDTSIISFKSPDCGGEQRISKLIYLKPEKVALTVFTFDKISELALEGCTVRLMDITNPKQEKLVDTKFNPTSNNFDFEAFKCHKYKIVADKEGYTQALDFFEIPCDTEKDSFTRDVFLIPGIYDLLPIRIFFDNDRPDRRTMRRTTTKSYEETYIPYLAKKDEFIREYGDQLTTNKVNGAEDLESFFDNDVVYGFDRLQFFMNALTQELSKGGVVEIMFKGHASPRAASDYNMRLGSRRISSVLNEFRNYKGGILAPFIDRGDLKITEAPVGEDEAPSGISDELQDRRNSIYSPEASWERRVEIIQVKKIGGQ